MPQTEVNAYTAQMDFSDSAKAKATKFLQDFCAQGLPPDGGLVLELNWPTFTQAELEGECLYMALNFLAKRWAPGAGGE